LLFYYYRDTLQSGGKSTFSRLASGTRPDVDLSSMVILEVIEIAEFDLKRET
jgi:hypothetical protein